jgi:type I restriction enzyme R subunit
VNPALGVREERLESLRVRPAIDDLERAGEVIRLSRGVYQLPDADLDPKDKTFTPFGEARFKIEGGVVRKSRQMYFPIYPWFNIIDYTGSATARFAAPDFDGYPEEIDITEIDDQGNTKGIEDLDPTQETPGQSGEGPATEAGETGQDNGPGGDRGIAEPPPRKYYVDGGQVKILGHVVYELDEDGNQLRVIQYTDYTVSQVRTLFRTADELRDEWADPVRRGELLERLEGIGVDFPHLAEATGQPDADPLDLLCHLAFQRPLRTRRERAEHLRKGQPDFFDRYSAKAREILGTLLDQYSEHGPGEFKIPDALAVGPIARYGNPMEIADLFGGPLEMRQAVDRLQALLYAE